MSKVEPLSFCLRHDKAHFDFGMCFRELLKISQKKKSSFLKNIKNKTEVFELKNFKQMSPKRKSGGNPLVSEKNDLLK